MEFPLPSFLPSLGDQASFTEVGGGVVGGVLLDHLPVYLIQNPLPGNLCGGVHSTFYDLVLGFVILAKTGGGGGFVCRGTHLVDMWFLRDFSRWWFQSSEYCV